MTQHSSNPIRAWKSAFFTDRNLDGPDGRALYAYRMSKDEFDSLAAVLKSSQIKTSTGQHWLSGADQLFVLYAPEWWRRCFEGGSWRWQDVLTSIEWPQLTPPQRQKVVSVGFRYWKRPLSRMESGNTAFLMSIVTEGGFPVKLIGRKDGRLSTYLRAILNDYTRYGAAGMDAVRIAESHEQRLPSAFRKLAVHELAAGTVEVISDLASQLESTTNPFEELSRKIPNWMDRLPLSFESDNARVLVNGLLQKAKASREAGYDQLGLSRYFTADENGLLRHAARVELPGSIPAEVIADQTGVALDSLPRRLELAVVTEDRLTNIASMRKEGDDYHVYIYGAERLRLNVSAVSAVECIVVQGDRGRLGGLPIVGGEGLDPELPVVSYKDEDQDEWVVLSQGSLASRLNTLYITLPPGAEIIDGADYEFLDGMACHDFQEAARWMSLHGRLDLSTEGQARFRIRAGTNTDDIAKYGLRGDRQYIYESSSNPVYLGMPRIYSLQAQKLVFVSPEDVVWTTVRGGPGWRSLNDASPLGDIKLRVLADGFCVYSGRCTVLPRDLSVRIQPGGGSTHGKVVLSGLQGAELLAPCGPVIETTVTVSPAGEIEISCASNQPYAGRISAELVWGAGQRCGLPIPFPGQGAHFCRSDGSQFEGSHVALDEMHRVYAVCVAQNNLSRPRLFCQLAANDVRGKLSGSVLGFESGLPMKSDGYFELPLADVYSRVKALFGYSADLDAAVRIEIIDNAEPLTRLQVVQFVSELAFDPSSCEIRHMTTEQKPHHERVDVRLISFEGGDLPDIGMSVLSGNGSYGVALERFPEFGTPWLAVAVGSEIRSIRPCVVFDPAAPTPVLTEETNVGLDNIWPIPSTEERKQALSDFTAVLAEGGMNEEWPKLVAAVRRFSEAHPDAIALFEAIIDDPVVAAGLMLRTTENDIAYLLDWENYLPFSWSHVPLTAWGQAIENHRHQVEQEVDLPEHAELHLGNARKQIAALTKRADNFKFMAEMISERFYDETDNKFITMYRALGPAKIYNLLDTKYKTELVTLCGDATWPQGYTRHDWGSIFGAKIPWLDVDGAPWRQTVFDTIIALAYSVVFGQYLTREQRAVVNALRPFSTKMFDDMVHSAQAAFYISEYS